MSTTATPTPQAFIFTTASGTAIPDPSPNSMTRARTRLEGPDDAPVPASLFPTGELPVDDADAHGAKRRKCTEE